MSCKLLFLPGTNALLFRVITSSMYLRKIRSLRNGIYLTWSSESCAFPPYGYQSLRRCRVITASRVALAVSQVAASCFCPVARIEFVNPGFASFPFSAFLHLGSPLALHSLCISISTYPPFPSHFGSARTANNVRSSLGRAWQRANAA